jgi:Ser/Thr protein kinase RdoA (MazF antagonist)
MTPPGQGSSELWSMLTPMVGRIARLEHRPSAFRTSFAIEEIDVILDDGTSLAILLKELSWQALLEDVRRVKPAFLHNPLREIEVYRGLLVPHPLGSATCYGTVIDAEADRYWLFLERVPGRELYQVGEFSTWQRVARWLAVFHRRFAPEARRLGASHLLRYDGAYYRHWLERARAFVQARSQDRSAFGRLAERYDRVIDRLLAVPTTFLHGDFHASNVLVLETAVGLRVCPVDWEMAAVGPGLMDLAALTAGGWSEAERTDLAFAYHAEWAAQGDEGREFADFLSDLDHCRLHQAVQWLGWAPEWSPPPEHRQDWLGEALRLADRIGL